MTETADIQLFNRQDVNDPHGMMQDIITDTLMKGINVNVTHQQRGSPEGRLDWALQHRSMLWPDIPLDFESHKYLKGIYDDEHPYIAAQKAAQLGLSEWLITDAFWGADVKGANTLYILPRTGDVSDFSATRFGLAIEASPYIASIIIADRGKSAGYQSRTRDRSTLKRIRNRFLYMRHGGVKADGRAPQLKTSAIDLLIYDEYDEIDSRAPSLAEKRLQHSSLKWQRKISTPSYANRGINAVLNESDYRVWMMKCEHCGHWQPLDPLKNLIMETDSTGRPVKWFHKRGKRKKVYAGCVKCAKPIDRLADGEWVAKFPGREIHGYYVNPLLSPEIDLWKIIETGLRTDPEEQRQWMNQTLGITYQPKGGGFSETKVNNSYRDYVPPFRSKRCAMGVDVGAQLHVIIRRYKGDINQAVFIGTVTHFEELDTLMERYGVRMVVVDALPETRKAREFADRWKHRAYVAFYVGGETAAKRAALVTEKEDEQTVEIDRTRAIDAVRVGYESGKTINYTAAQRDEPDHKTHLMSMTRVLNKRTDGKIYATWVATGADHYAHAEVYVHIAMQLMGLPVGGEGAVMATDSDNGKQAKKTRTPKPDRTTQGGWDNRADGGRKSAWQEE